MIQGIKTMFVLSVVLAVSTISMADAPLPLHTIEGNSGVFLTSTAYMANPPKEGEIIGLPSFSVSGAFIGDKDLQAYSVTENLFGRIEIGFATQRLGLGDWSNDVFQTTGLTTQNYVTVHNLNVRAMAVKEGDFDCPWMPAITFGSHFKWNNEIDEIDGDLGGCCDMLGADHDFGTDLTVVATKMIKDVLPTPVIITAGLRNGDAIHTGLCGFAGERETTFEGSLIIFLTDKLASQPNIDRNPT